MLIVYKNFIPQEIIINFTQLRWTRKYNDVGFFEMNTFFDAALFEVLTDGTGLTKDLVVNNGVVPIESDCILYKIDIREACIVEDINVYDDVDGSVRLDVRGRGLEVLLARRVATIQLEALVSITLLQVLNENFVNPTDPLRKVDGFSAESLLYSYDAVKKVDYKQKTSVLDIVNALTQPLGIGYKIDYDVATKSYRFLLYQGREDEEITYSSDLNNVVAQDWYFFSKDYKNVVYLTSEVNGAEVTAPIGDVSGINRREVFGVSVKDEDIAVTGARLLDKSNRVRSVNAQIDMLSPQFVYLKDWDVGDVLTFQNADLNAKIVRPVSEVHEFYDTGQRTIDVVFGDYIPFRR